MRRLFRLPWAARRGNDVDDELETHLAYVAEELRAHGWPAADAVIEARRRFGDLDYTRAYCREEDARREREKERMMILETLNQDFRYALRSLRKSPAFAITALLTLALGIGANTAIFSVVRGVLLDPLPFKEPDRIVRVWQVNHTDGTDQAPASEPDFLDWRAQSRAATTMGGYLFGEGFTGLDLTGLGMPERLSAALVTDGFFQTLGTPAMLGRVLQPEEHVAGRDRAVVLSYGFWRRRLGADAGIIGRTLELNGDPFTVVGVMPPEFVYPSAGALDVWIPLSFFGPSSIGRARGGRFESVIARLKPGATMAQLRADLAGISTRLAAQYAEDAGWDDVKVTSLRESMFGEVQRPLLVLMVAVSTLLLITCVNVAGLLLARASGRQRELAVRAALGAGRGRIARQLLTESLALALVGGSLGAGLAVVGVRALAVAGASQLPRANDIRVDGVVLLFTLAVSVLAGLLFGVLPSLRATSPNLAGVLRAGARGSVGGTGQRARSALVVGEMALAVILVAGAGLAIKSFSRLLAVDPGFEPGNALVVTLTVPPRYLGATGNKLAYYENVLAAVRRVPGVRAAGSIRDVPLRGNGERWSFSIPGQSFSAGQEPSAQMHQISDDFFRAMGVPLRGRDFTLADRDSAPPVIIVNQSLAKRYWPTEDAIGKSIVFGTSPVPIVGVVGDVRQRGLAEPTEPMMYMHALQNFRARMSIVVRTAGAPLSYANALRRAVWSVDPDQTITSTTTLQSVLGDSVARPRLLAWLLALFGTLGLSLGALGIFGVLAYAVSQRRQEIGVRVALGASPRSVLSLIVGQGMLLAGAGVTIGILGAVFLTRSMQSVLYDIQPSDLTTFVEVVLVLLGASLLASWVPARRAIRIDPVTALRYD
jgi:predicted permease